MSWCDKSVLNDDCGAAGCEKCAPHRRNFNQSVLQLFEDSHRTAEHEDFPVAAPDPMFEVRLEMLRELSRLAHRLGQAEGMLEAAELVLGHGVTRDELEMAQKIRGFLEKV